MKRTKKDFTNFTKRNTHKRRDKETARRELLRAVEETEVAYSGIILKDTLDFGRGGRTSGKARRDETVSRGIFSGSKSGFGFVTLESGYDKDVFIPEDKTHGALDGDFVELIYHIYTSREGIEKTEGRITKIIEYGREFIIGTLVTERARTYGKKSAKQGGVYAFLQPDDPKIALRPRIIDTAGARDGDKIMVKIKRDGTSGYSPECYVSAVFGKADSKEANYAAILADSGIPVEFSKEELEFAERMASEPLSDEGRERFDNTVIFTIDGAGAKDLDDAVSLKRIKDGWQLGVHIAYVSSYVPEKCVLDRLVMNRGTSVYFTDKVVPMLPECLSNGACSLNAGEDKYALSAIINLDSQGNITKTKIVPSIIRSRLRGVYSEVNAVLSGDADAEISKKYRPVAPTLVKMRELYEILSKKAEDRGYLDMSIDEAVVILDEAGRPKDVVRAERGVAERIIEQFMLTANEAVATLLTERSIPCVYRVHERPSPDKLETFVTFLKHMGLKYTPLLSEDASGKDYAAVLSEAEQKGVGAAVSRTMLRSMMKAKYSEIRESHFGLGIDFYCHFTSPIRRLSDLATHRIIHKVLIDGKRPEAYVSYAKRAARAASETELRALNAERRIENLYKTIYMSDFIGETFDASVSSVTSFGMFCELDNTCEGLIPISEMPGLFIFNEENLTLRSGNLAYRIGDTVRVRIEEADVIRGKLRFSPCLIKKSDNNSKKQRIAHHCTNKNITF